MCAEQCLAAPGLKVRLPMEVTWEGQRRASPTKARVLAKRIRAVAAWARLSLPRETVRQQLRVDRPLPFAGIRSRVCRRKRDHGSVRHAFKTKPQNQRGLCCGFILEHAYVERIGSVAYGEGYPDQGRSLGQNRDLAKEDAPKICGTRDLIQFNLPRHGAPLVCGETASAIGGLRENGRQAFLRLPATPVHGICCGREKDRGKRDGSMLGVRKSNAPCSMASIYRVVLPTLETTRTLTNSSASAASLRMS